MIHRALFGSVERFFGVLTEHYAGAFPPWLAPVQVVGIPVTDEHVDYLERCREAAAGRGDPGRGRRLRRPDAEEDPQRQQGEGALRADRRRRGPEQGAVSFRYRDGSQHNGVPVDEARRGDRGRRPRPGPRSERARGCPARSTELRRATSPGSRTGSSGSGRRTGWRTSTGRTSRRDRTTRAVPVLPGAAAQRRGRPDRAPGRHGVRRAEPVPVQPGHLMVCPYRHVAVHRPDRRRRPSSLGG